MSEQLVFLLPSEKSFTTILKQDFAELGAIL